LEVLTAAVAQVGVDFITAKVAGAQRAVVAHPTLAVRAAPRDPDAIHAAIGLGDAQAAADSLIRAARAIPQAGAAAAPLAMLALRPLFLPVPLLLLLLVLAFARGVDKAAEGQGASEQRTGRETEQAAAGAVFSDNDSRQGIKTDRIHAAVGGAR
jgi:hypothetical protein